MKRFAECDECAFSGVEPALCDECRDANQFSATDNDQQVQTAPLYFYDWKGQP